ncbi:MAG: hypothetical protein GQE15_31545 [Archangiaceae bacterium]|nr:hypothetical protein [Archangiaceae bacterium]
MAFYAVGVHRLLLVTLIIAQTGPARRSSFTWQAPVDFGAPCPDAGLPSPGVCMGGVAQRCVDLRQDAKFHFFELCNDQCVCPFGSTCVGNSSDQRICQKVCFAQSDCGGGLICHRFWNSTVSACVTPTQASWFLPSDFKPDERKYWSPTYRWLEPYRYEPPSPAQRIKEGFRSRP